MKKQKTAQKSKRRGKRAKELILLASAHTHTHGGCVLSVEVCAMQQGYLTTSARVEMHIDGGAVSGVVNIMKNCCARERC